MRKNYKCSNIKFCMEDENQRRTWEYLQGITRKDGSYGKILSDAFVTVLDRQIRIGTDKAEDNVVAFSENPMDAFGEMLDRALKEKFHEMLQEWQDILAERISSGFSEYASAFYSRAETLTERTDADETEQMQETELSEDMVSVKL